MILIISIPILNTKSLSVYTGLILAGLGFALVGDILLMLPRDYFLGALIAFLITHLCYSVGFLLDQGFPVLWPILPVFGLTTLVGWFFKDNLGKLKIPAYSYLIVISMMIWLACSRWITGNILDNLLAMSGAILFGISDLILSVNRFKVEFKAARGLDLSIYYIGQWLIALSAIGLSHEILLPG
jgi:uncharacterized membrane protein YhhN